MNFDDALKRYLPRAWFRYKFIKYKHLGRGEPELHLVRHLVQPGTTAIDVGASIGIFAAEMARHAGKVLAFEANPEVAAFTRRVMPRNVEVINVALSSQGGRATLTMPRNRKGHGTTELATIGRPGAAHADNAITVDVETRRLDDMAVSNCSFIKIDVEGHEEQALEGATALIARERPALMVEIVEAFNPGAVARLTARYAAMSFEGYFFSQDTLRPAATFDAVRDQHASSSAYAANFLFVPAERREYLRTQLPFASA